MNFFLLVPELYGNVEVSGPHSWLVKPYGSSYNQCDFSVQTIAAKNRSEFAESLGHHAGFFRSSTPATRNVDVSEHEFEALLWEKRLPFIRFLSRLVWKKKGSHGTDLALRSVAVMIFASLSHELKLRRHTHSWQTPTQNLIVSYNNCLWLCNTQYLYVCRQPSFLSYEFWIIHLHCS